MAKLDSLTVVIGTVSFLFLCSFETSTVADVYEFVQSKTTLRHNEFYITVAGNKPLKRNISLSQYNIQPFSQLFVNFRGHGGDPRSVIVETGADEPDRSNPDEFLTDLPTLKDIQRRISGRIDDLCHVLPCGKHVPLVCAFCDEFLLSRHNILPVSDDILSKVVKELRWDANPDPHRPAAVEQYYSLPSQHEFNLDGVALSPRGVIRKKSQHHRAKNQILACQRCSNSIRDSEKIPKYAIANHNYVGATPQCLLDLTDIEVAMLTPTKSYGFFYTFQGGTHQNLKGCLTFMRVKKRSTARALTQLEILGLKKHIIVLAEGNMTPLQHARAKQLARVRVEYLLIALEWICTYHKKWKQEIDLNALREELEGRQPIWIDKSTQSPSVNTNVEEEELFSCFFPDGATTPQTGGFDTREDFRGYVEQLAREGYEVEFKATLKTEYLTKQEDIIETCLLQFPYGLGGFEEIRRKPSDGSFTDKVNICDYLEHLLKVSQPVFQKPLFQLICYHYFSRQEILRTSRFKLKGDVTAEALANGTQYKDVAAAVDSRRRGNHHAGNHVSKTILDACKTTGKSLPHTNEAATLARGNGEAMQHHFGIGSIWLTVSFDDHNSWIMQAYSGFEPIDDGTDPHSLTDEECRKRCTKRQELRVGFPGLSGLYFEMMLEILCEEVIGWDMKNHKPTDQAGYFGDVIALCLAIEEQARKTLHGHFTIWIEGFRALQKKLFFPKNKYEKSNVKKKLVEYHRRLCSTRMFDAPPKELIRAFEHNCSHKHDSTRSLPIVVEDQALRNLRHRKGYDVCKGLFAYCPHCEHPWTYEQLLACYVVKLKGFHEGNILDSNWNPTNRSIPVNRLKAHIVDFQKNRDHDQDVPVTEINATYNHHSSKHVCSCFKCAKTKKRKHVCGEHCECRYRMPDRQRQRTSVKDVPGASNRWYTYSGKVETQPIVEFLPTRATYDLFQNVTCPAISHSKFACNSNVALITDGPVSQYQFKYQMKKNQKEETADYEEVLKSIRGLNGRKHPDDDKAEAIRILTRTAFAHNKTNVIAPAFAGYLTRMKSRFYFSHEFQWVPLRDIIKLQDTGTVSGTYQFGKVDYFENQALHYICRPEELEDASVKDFFELYNVVKLTRDVRERGFLELVQDVGEYSHPAFKKGNWIQGVEIADPPKRIKVAQRSFPDAAKFGADILTCDESEFAPEMETYARLVLTLFLPFRNKEDLMTNDATFPFTRKLREIFEYEEDSLEEGVEQVVFREENVTFLQNIQDCAYNSLRYKLEKDDLARNTEAFVDPNMTQAERDQQEKEEEEEEEDESDPIDDILHELNGDDVHDPTDTDPAYLRSKLQDLTFEQMRFRGKDGCGFDTEWEVPFVPNGFDETKSVAFESSMGDAAGAENNEMPKETERFKYKIDDVVEVLFRKSTRRRRGKEVFPNNPRAKVHDATGNVRSIQEWAKAAKLDHIQKRAFLCVCAAFVLTFFDPPENSDSDLNVKYNTSRDHLKVLRGTGDEAAVLLMHGPGGSGKTTVIDLVIEYAREFCTYMDHPFTSRTICVTACSGVAATLIMGETVHSAFGTARKQIPDEFVDAFKDCRLVFIDEISFLPKELFSVLDQHMRKIFQEHYKKYGGQNVVFAGDFSQMEPVQGTPVYKKDRVQEFQDFVNCYVELDGMHRFRTDPEWGEMNMRFRQGKPTVEDIETINENCLVENRLDNPPEGVQVATYGNKERDAINTSVFDQYCEQNRPDDDSVLDSALLVFMDELMLRDQNKSLRDITSNTVIRHFYENCGENSLEVGEKKNGKSSSKGRVDPCLKLYHHCPMMYTQNTNVLNGEANGSRVLFEKAFLKHGEQKFIVRMENGTKVPAVFASQLKCLRVRHLNSKINPPIFDLEPKQWSFMCNLYIGTEKRRVRMRGTQIGLISNTATTGHKLQGCTVDSLLVNDWTYGKNWSYVVLSRVRTMVGLFMKKALSTDLKKYEMCPEMEAMIAEFRTNKSIPTITEDQMLAMLLFCDQNSDNGN